MKLWFPRRQQYDALAELRAWELTFRILERIQDQSRFFHFWHHWT